MTADRGRRSGPHDEFRLLAAASVDGRLSADEAAALDAHLAGCAPCRADLNGMVQDHAWLAAPGPVVAPGPRIRDAVLDAARSGRVPRTGDRRRPWEALAAASLVIALIGAGVLFGAQRWTGLGTGGINSFGPASIAPRSPAPTTHVSVTPPTPIPLATSVTAGPCVRRPSGLTAWWPGDDGRDVIGGRDLLLRGNARYAPGLVGGALTLDGLTGYAEVQHDPSLDLGTSDFTIMLWVQFDRVFNEQVLIEQWRDFAPGTPAAGWTLTKLADQSLLFTGESSGAGQSVTTPPIELLPHVWYHVATRRGGGQLRLWIDGELIGTAALDRPIDLNLDSPLLLGRRSDDRGFLLDGQLDDVKLVIGRALFDTDIAAAYLAGSTGTCTG